MCAREELQSEISRRLSRHSGGLASSRSSRLTFLDRLITAKDHASIQLQIADVDADGKAIRGQSTTIAICGRIRAQGDSDDSINRIATQAGRKSWFPCSGWWRDRVAEIGPSISDTRGRRLLVDTLMQYQGAE